MKKLLALLGAASAVAAPATAVIACVQPQTDNNTNNGGDTDTDGNNNGGGDENTEETPPTTLEELEKNPFDLSKLDAQEVLKIEAKTTISESKTQIVNKINELININELIVEDIDFEFDYDRNKENFKDENGTIYDLDKEDGETNLITFDKVTVKSVSQEVNKYFQNSANIVVSQFNLSASSYSPTTKDTVSSFLSDIDTKYSLMFGLKPDFYKHVDLKYYASEGASPTVVKDDGDASECKFVTGAYLDVYAKEGDNLFTGGTRYNS